MKTEVIVVKMEEVFEVDLEAGTVEFLAGRGVIPCQNDSEYKSPTKTWNDFTKAIKEIATNAADDDERKRLEKEYRESFKVFKKHTFYLSDLDLAKFFRAGVPMKVVGTASLDVTAESVSEVLVDRLMETTNKFLDGLQKANELSFNAKCGTPKVDESLLRINDVQLCEDCCTDVLKEQLSRGWRILAVCPQPDQRRPDYILGRAN